MKLEHEFYKLPLSFDVEKLQQEVSQLTESDWHAHHEGFKGNIAVPLLSVGGGINNEFKGAIAKTAALEKLPYIKQVLASFNEVFGRSRLMALEPGCSVPPHSDINYHWYKRVRIHIPITTTPDVIFSCHDKQVHMAAGECWIFDSWKNHNVENNSSIRRIHLVVDTMGSSNFWNMIDNSEVPGLKSANQATKFIAFDPALQPQILTERYSIPVVLSAAEIDSLINDLIMEVKSNPNNDINDISVFEKILKDFTLDWRRLWTLYDVTEDGWPHYHELRDKTYNLAKIFEEKLRLINDGNALQMLIHCIIDPALNPEAVLQKENLAQPISKPIAKATEKPIAKNKSEPSKSAEGVVPVSRNSPCQCGSGKKFKQCCGIL
ncbi:aspartyl/asparaginyl beta-hydroxylase domain-containing protein [Colwelliaceae bacterium BS250]